MNFLAHLTLSCHDPGLQMGNLLGDFTKGKPPAHYPAALLDGLVLHRLIDRTTDAHPEVRQLNKQLKLRHGRYAGVISDVVFDFYLYRHWSRFGPLPFDEFAAEVYRNVADHLPLLKPTLRNRLQSMAEHQWLNSYKTTSGILSVFDRMRPRFSAPQLLSGLDLTLMEMDEQFNHSFLSLFPDLVLTVNDACGCH